MDSDPAIGIWQAQVEQHRIELCILSAEEVL
jgi:hypothetical protein